MPRTRALKKKAAKESQPEESEPKEEKAQEEEDQEFKEVVKAKKYKKKTVEEIARINRSKNDRIFLIEAKRVDEEEQWQFTVQGTKGSHYHVKVSTQVKCTCMDFRLKQKPCKHIYFIVTQVGQNEELLDFFRDKKTISKNAYKFLDSQLYDRLKRRMEVKDAKEIDLKDDTNCVICFTEMEKETQALQDCGTCKKYFHCECIAAWKMHNPTCPLCRGALAGGGKDPLGLLKGVQV